MRFLIVIALLSLITLIGWFSQNPQYIPQFIETAIMLFPRSTPEETGSTNDDSNQEPNSAPETSLREMPYMYQTLPAEAANSQQSSMKGKRTTKKNTPAAISKHTSLNLDLPSTIHPTTPPLQIPVSQKLFLESEKTKTTNISVGGGIEWDEKANKARGAKISITIPTG